MRAMQQGDIQGLTTREVQEIKQQFINAYDKFAIHSNTQAQDSAVARQVLPEPDAIDDTNIEIYKISKDINSKPKQKTYFAEITTQLKTNLLEQQRAKRLDLLILAAIARTYLIMPTSSTIVKVVFSQGSDIATCK